VGVWRTRVGYAGGTKEQPTYRSMGDHTECFQVDFDPAELGYQDLLEMFWTSHDPTRPAWKTQYASLILAHDEDQRVQAVESAERLKQTVGRPVATRIDTLERFWLAEDYHQKYYLRNDRLLFNEMRAAYPDEAGLVDSTAAARINGYLYGSASCVQLENEIPELGLSERAAGHLRMHCQG
jgi:peptide-methionine (S)-S-oxide reductase